MNRLFGLAIAVLATTALALAQAGTANATKSAGDDKPGSGEWSGGPGQGITFSMGDEFKITLKSFIQPLYTSSHVEDADDINNADIRRARTSLYGHVYRKEVKYKVQLDFADSSDDEIKDAWIDWALLTGDCTLALRGGQQKTGFGREHSASSTSLDFLTRALATKTLTNIRSRGVRVHGTSCESQLSYYAGIFNTDVAATSTAADEDGSNDDEKPNYHGGIAWSSNPGKSSDSVGDWAPLGDLGRTEDLVFAIGANGMVANQDGGAVGDVRVTGLNGYVEVKCMGAAILGEYFYRDEDPETGEDATADGFQVGMTYSLPASEDSNDQWVFGARVSMIDIEDDMYLLRKGLLDSSQWPAGTTGEITDVDFVAGFFDEGHNLKYQAQVTLRRTNPDGTGDFDDTIVAIQATLVF